MEFLKTFVTPTWMPIADISVPDVKNISIEVSDLGSYAFIKGFGPADISILLALVH
jgi:hypothetical protein